MSVLNQMNIQVGPVLVDAAINHFHVCGTAIDCFILPKWMFEKLSKEPGFELAGTAWIARYDGFTVFRANHCGRATMRETGSSYDYNVFQEGE